MVDVVSLEFISMVAIAGLALWIAISSQEEIVVLFTLLIAIESILMSLAIAHWTIQFLILGILLWKIRNL